MPRQLVLSVGLHKTGSTSIQETCASNETALLDAGFVYPEFRANGRRIANPTGAFHFMFRRAPEKMGYVNETKRGERAGAVAIGEQLKEGIASRLSINEEFGPGFLDGMANARYADHRVFRLHTIPGPKFALRRDEVAPMLCMLVAENEWLKDTLGEQYCDPRLEFGDQPCVWTEESRAHLNALLETSTPDVRSLAASYLAASDCAGRAGTTTQGH